MQVSSNADGGVQAERETWDLFCRVVDNYGDVGIAWRLAKQLVADDRVLRLVVDGLDVLGALEPRMAPTADRQRIAGVEVRSWSAFSGEPADVVVELLGCGLPAAYLDAMEVRRIPTVWIDYEHLSAEAWIDDFHARPSPHPQRPLTKHFFYPGFGAGSGGLPIERRIDERRRAFIEDASAVAAFRERLGIPDARRHLSLFAYADAPVAALFDALASDAFDTWSVVVPDGVLVEPIAAWFDAHGAAAGVTRSTGALSVTTTPFVDQDDYDRLLWSCDFNCVRGEDSFVRAQLAARPFVWAPYRQADDVHLHKLSAFNDRYEAGLPEDARVAHRDWSALWNDTGRGAVGNVIDSARAWLKLQPGLQAHAERWGASLLAEPPLVDRLVAFASNRRCSC